MNIAYKGTYNLTCRDQVYEVGRTYQFEGPIRVCEQGFHFCIDAENIFNYYPFTKNFKMLEIEILGAVAHKDDKSVTDKFRIIKEISLHEMTFKRYKFNSSGQLLGRTDINGRAIAINFDFAGNPIHMAHAGGYQCWLTYNKDGNVIHRIDTNNKSTFYNYDGRGCMISREIATVNTNSLFDIRKLFKLPKPSFGL